MASRLHGPSGEGPSTERPEVPQPALRHLRGHFPLASHGGAVVDVDVKTPNVSMYLGWDGST